MQGLESKRVRWKALGSTLGGGACTRGDAHEVERWWHACVQNCRGERGGEECVAIWL